MQSKGLWLSLVMLVAIGSVSLSTSVVRRNVDLDGIDAMEKLALIMAAAVRQEFTANAMEINCIEKVGWSKDLTDTVLNDMMTIFKGKSWFKPDKVFIPPRTYIFAPECPKLSTKGHVYVSGDGNHAEDNMAAYCGLPTEFYLTSAPCPDCAMMLYNMYKSYSTKPTIHIACRYQGKGKEGSEGNLNVNLHCLAMLMNAGFTLTPWNWSAFKDNYIDNNDCKNSLKDMIDDMKYQGRYGKIDKAINDAKMMSGDHSQICSNAAKNGK